MVHNEPSTFALHFAAAKYQHGAPSPYEIAYMRKAASSYTQNGFLSGNLGNFFRLVLFDKLEDIRACRIRYEGFGN